MSERSRRKEVFDEDMETQRIVNVDLDSEEFWSGFCAGGASGSLGHCLFSVASVETVTHTH